MAEVVHSGSCAWQRLCMAVVVHSGSCAWRKLCMAEVVHSEVVHVGGLDGKCSALATCV